MTDLHKWIKSYPDFPSKGILFRDISPILAEPEALKLLKESFTKAIKPLSPKYIAGIDARGFLFCTLVAESLGDLIEISYELEYGSSSLSMQ